MPDRSSPETDLLRAAYTALNARDIDAALATMAPQVTWQGFGVKYCAVRCARRKT